MQVGERHYPLLDISEAGLRFRVTDPHAPFQLYQGIKATLHLPSHPSPSPIVGYLVRQEGQQWAVHVVCGLTADHIAALARHMAIALPVLMPTPEYSAASRHVASLRRARRSCIIST
jgi:hypothetical protein